MSHRVELVSVERRYGGNAAVDGVSLTVEPGELVALLGPSGCGKTTSLRIVAGFVPPTAGSVRIADRDVTRLPPYRRDTGMVFQSYALFPHMTVAENIAFGLRRRRVPAAEIESRVQRIVAMLRLEGLERRLPRQLSGGQQQRVAVGRALVINPAVLLLDEPFSNLDAQLRETTRVELRRLQKELGITTLFVTHDQAEAMAIADRVAVMRAGRIEQVGLPEAIYRRPSTRFVASFIGRANLIEAEITGSEGEKVRARGEDGLLLEGCAPASRRSGKATFVLRPEAIAVERPPSPEGVNSTRAKVDFVSFLGSSSQLELLVGSRRLLVELPGESGSGFRPGDEVGLRWSATSLIAIED